MTELPNSPDQSTETPTELPNSPEQSAETPTESQSAAKPLTLVVSSLIVLLAMIVLIVALGALAIASVSLGAVLLIKGAPWQVIIPLLLVVVLGGTLIFAWVNKILIQLFGYERRSFWQILIAHFFAWIVGTAISCFLSAGLLGVGAALGGDKTGDVLSNELSIIVNLIAMVLTIVVYGFFVTIDWNETLAKVGGGVFLTLIVLFFGVTPWLIGSLIESWIDKLDKKTEINYKFTPSQTSQIEGLNKVKVKTHLD